MARRSSRLHDKLPQSPPAIIISPEHKLLIKKELKVDLSCSKIITSPTTPKTLRIKKELDDTSGEPNKNDSSKWKEKIPLQENLQISEYEKQILQNIEERKKMFELVVGDAKKDFMKSIVPTASPTQRGLKRKSDR